MRVTTTNVIKLKENALILYKELLQSIYLYAGDDINYYQEIILKSAVGDNLKIRYSQTSSDKKAQNGEITIFLRSKYDNGLYMYYYRITLSLKNDGNIEIEISDNFEIILSTKNADYSQILAAQKIMELLAQVRSNTKVIYDEISVHTLNNLNDRGMILFTKSELLKDSNRNTFPVIASVMDEIKKMVLEYTDNGYNPTIIFNSRNGCFYIKSSYFCQNELKFKEIIASNFKDGIPTEIYLPILPKEKVTKIAGEISDEPKEMFDPSKMRILIWLNSAKVYKNGKSSYLYNVTPNVTGKAKKY